jgi:hypothetical protein
MKPCIWKVAFGGWFLICVFLLCGISLADDDVNDKWKTLFQREPFVYTVPVVATASPLDGTYVKKAKKEDDIVPCRRCPDWLPNPGIWRLNIKQGAYRIINTTTGWKSLGTYIVSGDRILFANDPACIHGLGVYRWRRQNGRLTFELIDDPCAIKLRAKNLTEVSWHSCQPPNMEAAVTEHRPKPAGCR